MVNRCRWFQQTINYIVIIMTRSGESLLVTTKTFELLCLESYQSGLSWLTVLKKTGL